MKPYMSIE